MEILYISQYYPPEACAPAARVEGFAREWARSGAEVSVLTGFPNHPEGVLHPQYRRRWRQGFVRETREAVRVYRTWLYPSANRGLWGRSVNFASFALSAAVSGPFLAPQNGVVIATSPQILVGVSGLVVSSLRFRPWVFEVRDLWPESLVGVGQTTADSLLYRGVGAIAGALYRLATHVVVDGEWKRRHLVDLGVDERRISVIMNGVEEGFCVDPDAEEASKARRELRKELGLRNEFVLLYAGTLGMAHGLETVLQAAERLRYHSDIIFLVMGAGAERDRICKLVQEMGLSNVRLQEKQPRERVPAFLAAADACLIPLRNRDVFKTAIPSKLFETMAAGKPAILGVDGEAAEIVVNNRAGVAVQPEDPQALAEAIVGLKKEPSRCRILGRNGRQAVLQKYLRERQAAQYLNLLSELCRQPGVARLPQLQGVGGRGNEISLGTCASSNGTQAENLNLTTVRSENRATVGEYS
jgi:colanic acid biosynthesis glycosyl transferase WcaI